MSAPRPSTWLVALALEGAAVGVAASAAQLALLEWGALDAVQLRLLVGAFAVAGALLSLAGSGLVRLLRGPGLGLLPRAAAGALAAAAAFAVLLPLNTRERPHVYWFVTDTTRADHLSLYGYARKTTPFLEELAREAVVFSHAVSQGSHTIVTTPCLLASCYPSEHGLRDYDDVLAPEFTLISEYLSARGYRSFGFATNPHLGRRNGFAQGFEVYREFRGSWKRKPDAELVNRAFVDWLDAGRAGPVFAFLFYIDPHNPYAPPGGWGRRFDPDYRGGPVSDWDRDWGAPAPDDPRLANLVARYDGAIAYWDAELGKLVGELERRGLLDNALWLYTSDHGEEFFEHGHWGHNRTLFEESIRVPLVISLPPPLRWPPLPRVAGVVEEVVSSVDVLPSVLDYLGLEPEPRVRGRSVLPLMLGRGGAEEERVAYCEEILERYGPYDVRAVRTRTHKYVRVLRYEDATGTPRDLFFDLRADPGETRNLAEAGRAPGTAEAGGDGAALAALLDRRIGEMARATTAPRRKTQLPEEELERLRLLGYLDDGS